MCSEQDTEETFLEKVIKIPVIDNHKSMNYYFKNKLMGPEIPVSPIYKSNSASSADEEDDLDDDQEVLEFTKNLRQEIHQKETEVAERKQRECEEALVELERQKVLEEEAEVAERKQRECEEALVELERQKVLEEEAEVAERKQRECEEALVELERQKVLEEEAEEAERKQRECQEEEEDEEKDEKESMLESQRAHDEQLWLEHNPDINNMNAGEDEVYIQKAKSDKARIRALAAVVPVEEKVDLTLSDPGQVMMGDFQLSGLMDYEDRKKKKGPKVYLEAIHEPSNTIFGMGDVVTTCESKQAMILGFTITNSSVFVHFLNLTVQNNKAQTKKYQESSSLADSLIPISKLKSFAMFAMTNEASLFDIDVAERKYLAYTFPVKVANLRSRPQKADEDGQQSIPPPAINPPKATRGKGKKAAASKFSRLEQKNNALEEEIKLLRKRKVINMADGADNDVVVVTKTKKVKLLAQPAQQVATATNENVFQQALDFGVMMRESMFAQQRLSNQHARNLLPVSGFNSSSASLAVCSPAAKNRSLRAMIDIFQSAIPNFVKKFSNDKGIEDMELEDMVSVCFEKLDGDQSLRNSWREMGSLSLHQQANLIIEEYQLESYLDNKYA
jgi:hypothetical protein